MSPDQTLNIELGTASDAASDEDEALEIEAERHVDSGARPKSAHVHPRNEESPKQPHPSTGSRLPQLKWNGEQSMAFGSDIAFSHYPFLEANNLPNLLPQDASYLEMQGCFRVPIKPIMDEFVKQYFLYVHPLTPLLNEGEIWQMYSSQSVGQTRLSLLLCQAVLYSACSVS